jgi:RHS repeat-associated protein
MDFSELQRFCIAALAVFYAAFTHDTWAAAPSLDKHLVQGAELSIPSRGSIAGEYGSSTWTAGELSRGSYSLPIGLEFPSERGGLIYGINPQYSPSAGLTEWGLGVSFDLSIRRFRTSGGLDFQTDDFLSPWGHLVRGDDGNYYPKGLKAKVVIKFISNIEIQAYLEDGSTLVFGREQILQVPERGIYAWYLVEAKDNRKQQAVFEYERSKSNYLYLKQVFYGGVDSDFQYRLDFDYKHLELPFIDYRSTIRQELDRQISAVHLSAKTSRHQFSERYKYELRHQQIDLGPGFYLISMQKIYSHGGAAPIRTFKYDSSADFLKRAKWRPAKKLKPHLAHLGQHILSPSQTTQIDEESNGLMSFEMPRHDYSVLVQDENGYKVIPTHSSGKLNETCRPSHLTENPARRLVRLRGPTSPLEVLISFNIPHEVQTHVLVCSREGELREDFFLPNNWDLQQRTYLVDLDHDGKPDLIHFDGSHFQILKNLSTPMKIQFSTVPMKGILHSPSGEHVREVEPLALSLRDMNGDGIPDIVGKMPDGFFVWYGKGNYAFESQAAWFPVYFTRTEEVGSEMLAHFNEDSHLETSFQDLNGDGLADLIIFGQNQINVFLSDGHRFLERTPKTFLKILSGSCSASSLYLYSGDFSGDGNIQLLAQCLGEVFTYDFTEPGIGILSHSKDGKGNVLNFVYARARPEASIGSRPPVLSEFIVESGGKGPQTSEYHYSDAVTETEHLGFLGFRSVLIKKLHAETKSEFLVNEETSPLLQLSQISDKRVPAVTRFSETEYERTLFHNIPFYRVKSEVNGFGGPSDLRSAHLGNRPENRKGNEAISKKSYSEYQFDFCPSKTIEQKAAGVLTTVVSYLKPAMLTNHSTCLPSSVEISGTHDDASKNFVHNLSIQMNEWGQPTQLSTNAEEGSILQKIKYGKSANPEVITVPGKGSTHFEFDSLFRLNKVTQPDGTFVVATYNDSDLIQSVTQDHGGKSFIQNFHYDDLGRLSLGWNSLYPSSFADPLNQFHYQFASENKPGVILSDKRSQQDGNSLWSREFLFQSADGKDVASAIQSDAGWVIQNKQFVAPDEGSVTLQATSLSHATAETLRNEPHLASSAALSKIISSELGFPIFSTQKYQEKEEGTSEVKLLLSHSSVTVESTENTQFVTEVQQDADGNRLTFKDSAGNIYLYDHDVLGRIVKVSLPTDKETPLVHRIHYDGQGRVKEVDRTHLGKIRYAYKSGTNLPESKTYYGNNDEINRTTHFKYDQSGRLTEERQDIPKFKFFTADSKLFSFSYDGKLPNGAFIPGQLGFLTSVQGPDFTRINRYREDGKLSQTELELPNWKSLKESFEYQPDGTTQSKTLEYSNSPRNFVDREIKIVEHFDLDHLSRPAGIRVNDSRVAQIKYNQLSELEQVSLPSEDSFEFVYDRVTSKLEKYSGSIRKHKFDNSWNYDNRGLLRDEVFSYSDKSLKRTYQYTDQALLKGDRDSDANRSYRYDGIGMLTYYDKDSYEFQISSQGGSWLITQNGSTLTLNLDNLGRLIKTPTAELIYGPSGRVEKVVKSGAPPITYGYDETGVRTVKKVDGKIVEAYFDGMVLTDSSIYQSVAINGIIGGVLENENFRPLPTDFRGSVMEGNAGHASIVSPYGEREEARPKHSRVIDFVSQGYDADLQAYRMEQRDYDPVLKRFMSPDMLFLEQPDHCVKSPIECNLYSYAGGNPVSFEDPKGEKVLLASRPLNEEGLGKYGRHQFLIILPDRPQDFAGTEAGKAIQNLGNGKQGFVLGAYNIDDHLKTKVNAETDDFAAWRSFKGRDEGAMKTAEVTHCFISDTAFINNILEKTKNYNENSKNSPLSYPSPIENITGQGKNSNSFSQTLIRVSGGTVDTSKFDGYNSGQNNRINSWQYQNHGGK